MDLAKLKDQLKKQVWEPVYLIYGEENYLKEKALSLLKKSLPGENSDFNVDIIDGQEASPEQITALAETLPFFGQRRLVIVRETALFAASGNSSPDTLLKYLEDPAPHSSIVFTAANVDRRKKLFQALAKAGVVIECEPLRGEALLGWARERVRRAGKVIRSDALTRLCFNNSGGLGQLENDLEKIMLYIGDNQEITLAAVDALLPPNLENNVFTLIDAIGARRYEEARRLAVSILGAGEPFQRLLAVLAGHFRRLLIGKILSRQGFTEKQVASEMSAVEGRSVHPYTVRKSLAQSRNFSETELEQAMIKFAGLDASVKKGLAEPERALDMVLLELIEKKL